jgi:hypothetical protein
MLPLGGHLLREAMFHRVGAKGLMQRGSLQSVKEGVGPVVVCERQELLALLGQWRVGGGQGLEISLGDVP